MNPKPPTSDLYGRTWKGKRIGWITIANNSKMAEYSWVRSYNDKGKNRKDMPGKWKLVYDLKNGMYDSKGNYIKEPIFEKKAVLMTEDMLSFENFPDNEEAQEFRWNLEHRPNVVDIDDDDSVFPCDDD